MSKRSFNILTFVAAAAGALFPGRALAQEVYVAGDCNRLVNVRYLTDLVQEPRLYGTFDVGIAWKTAGPDALMYNAPRVGIGFSYAALGACNYTPGSRMGDSFAVYGFFMRDLVQKGWFSAGYDAEFGMALMSDHYDKFDNPLNVAYGGPFTFHLKGGLYAMARVTDRLTLGIEASYRHNSSCRFFIPNRGINAYGCSLSARYALGQATLTPGGGSARGAGAGAHSPGGGAVQGAGADAHSPGGGGVRGGGVGAHSQGGGVVRRGGVGAHSSGGGAARGGGADALSSGGGGVRGAGVDAHSPGGGGVRGAGADALSPDSGTARGGGVGAHSQGGGVVRGAGAGAHSQGGGGVRGAGAGAHSSGGGADALSPGGGGASAPDLPLNARWRVSVFGAGGPHKCNAEYYADQLLPPEDRSDPYTTWFKGSAGAEAAWRYCRRTSTAIQVELHYISNTERLKVCDLAMYGRQEGIYSPWAPGIAAAQEFYLGPFSAGAGMGVYLWRHVGIHEDHSRFYQKVFLRYYPPVLRSVYMGISMRAHTFSRADYLEFCLGWILFHSR